MNPLDRVMSVFKNSYATATDAPAMNITVRDAAEHFRTGRMNRHFVEEARRALAEGDVAKSKEMKKRTFCYTFSGRFRGNSKDKCTDHTGLVCTDWDEKPGNGFDFATTWKRVTTDRHVALAFRSTRGEGIKAVVHVEQPPEPTDACHKQAVAAVQRYYDSPGFDTSLTDLNRFCYGTIDPDIYINEDAVPLPVDYSATTTAAKVPSERRVYDETIPDGEKYGFATVMAGALRRLHLGPEIIQTAVTSTLEEHGESPIEDYDALNKMCQDIGTKQVDERTSWKSFMRSIQSLQSIQSTEGDASYGDETEPLSWVPPPIAAMPSKAAAYAKASAAAIGCDVAFVMVPMLSVLAMAVGNSFRIQLKQSWTEISALWTLVIGLSGSAKSPALEAAVRPIYHVESLARKRHEEAMRAYEADLEAWKEMPKDERGEKPQPPRRKRQYTGDATVESLVLLQNDNARGIGVIRDELGGLLGSLDRYASGASDMQAYIEFHGGRPYTVDRKTGDRPALHVASPCVSMTGTTQPQIAQNQFTQAHFVSGFAPRMMMAYPPTQPRRWTDSDVMPDVRDGYMNLVKALYDLPFDAEEKKVLGLTPGAKRLFKEFVNENGALIDRLPGGALRSALAKIEATAARIALVLHLADHVDGVGSSLAPTHVSEDAMRRAIMITRWFRYETARIYQKLGFEDRSLSDDERLVQQLPKEFTWRDVSNAANVKESGAHKILRRLRQGGLVEKIEHGKYTKCGQDSVEFGQFAATLEGSSGDETVQTVQAVHSTEDTIGKVSPSSGDGLSREVLFKGQRVATPGSGPGTIEEVPDFGKVRVHVDSLATTPMPVRSFDASDLQPLGAPPY